MWPFFCMLTLYSQTNHRKTPLSWYSCSPPAPYRVISPLQGQSTHDFGRVHNAKFTYYKSELYFENIGEYWSTEAPAQSFCSFVRQKLNNWTRLYLALPTTIVESQTMMESDFSCWTLLWRCVLLDLQKLPVRANAHFEAVNGLVSLKIGVLPIKIEQIEMQNK